MIWMRSARYCEGGTVDLIDLASSRSNWGMGRATVVFHKRLGKALIAKGAGHGSMETVSYVTCLCFIKKFSSCRSYL